MKHLFRKKILAYSGILAVTLNGISSNLYAQDLNAAKAAGVDLSKDLPTRTPGQKPADNSLEHGIWVESDKVEKSAKTSGERTNHRELEKYIGDLMAKITGNNNNDIRVYVMERPFFNASVAPNGYTEVWTGLLLRVDTEDELAFVLGHEAGHYLHSHSIAAYESYKDRQKAVLAARLVIAAATAAAAANASTYSAAQNIGNLGSTLVDVIYLGSMVAFMGYSRDAEERADIYGYSYATRAGFNPKAGEYIWQNRLNETAASDYDRVRKSPTRINIFGSHPLETDRITNLAQYGAKTTEPKTNQTLDDLKAARVKYRNIIRPYMSSWLKDDLRRQDYGQTIFIINGMMQDSLDLGILNYYKGEAYRLRGKNDDLTNALKFYDEAAKYPDAPIETYRQIGELYRRMNNNEMAIVAYKRYVTDYPNAEDAWIIEDTITNLSKNPAAPIIENNSDNTKSTNPKTGS